MFINALDDGHLDCFQFWTVMNKAAIKYPNTGLYMDDIFISWVNIYQWNWENMLRVGHTVSMFTRDCQIALQNSWAVLHSH